MSNYPEGYIDSPTHDVHFLRYVAAGSLFILSPVFIILMLTEISFALWIGLAWIMIPVIIFLVPYVLVVPAIITTTDSTLLARHGKRTLKFPFSIMEYCEIIEAPPSWVNNHYLFPNAQWVHIRKSKGFFKSWYIPATSATKLTLAIREKGVQLLPTN
ncbi:MAG: hypothetical protein ACW98Y_05710 [Candidatus Thorarchaeota archaeon]|jgi:hypothetical protein